MVCYCIFVAVLAVAAYGYYWWNQRQARRIELDAIIVRQLKDRDTSIDLALKAGEKVDPELRTRIGALSFQELRESLQDGTYTALDVVRTYLWKGVKAHEKTNCVTTFVKEAEDWAMEWDEKAKDPSFTKPTFFGIPVSIKECIPMSGYDLTRGFVQDCGRPEPEDLVLVQHLKKLGMVPFCRTNVPQSLLAFQSVNPVYGATGHPLDSKRTPGGSSGGESAIIAAGGSIIGMGGDVGGSIRIPCHFTGIAGIKASHMRFSHRGTPGAIPGRPLINANDGPMTKDIRSTVDFLREVWSDNFQHEMDAYVPPVKFNEDLYKEGRKFRIGYYVDDGWFKPIPAVQRAVMEAKAILEAKGHTIVPFHPPRIGEMLPMYMRALLVDSGAFLRKKMLKDIIDPNLYSNFALMCVPVWVQRLLKVPISIFFPRLANIIGASTTSTVELRETYAAIECYRAEYTELMRKNQIDVLLCPPQVMVAPPHATPTKVFPTATYTFLYNLLDYGAGVVNMTKVTEKDEAALQSEYPRNDAWDLEVIKACTGTVGFPVGVQVAAPPFREEAVLRVLRDIELAVTGK